jgi:hypothetical protein
LVPTELASALGFGAAPAEEDDATADALGYFEAMRRISIVGLRAGMKHEQPAADIASLWGELAAAWLVGAYCEERDFWGCSKEVRDRIEAWVYRERRRLHDAMLRGEICCVGYIEEPGRRPPATKERVPAGWWRPGNFRWARACRLRFGSEEPRVVLTHPVIFLETDKVRRAAAAGDKREKRKAISLRLFEEQRAVLLPLGVTKASRRVAEQIEPAADPETIRRLTGLVRKHLAAEFPRS